MSRRGPWQAPAILAIGFTLSAALFVAARSALLAPFRAKVEADVSVRTRLVQQDLEKALLAVEAFGRRANGAAIDATAFRAAAAAALRENEGIGALLWARRVEGPGREVSFPVVRVAAAPSAPAPGVGADLARDARWRVAVEAAGGAARAAAAPLGPSDVALVLPVPDAGGAEAAGVVGAVLDLDRLVAAALQPTKAIGLPFRLLMLPGPDDRGLSYHWTARHAAPASWRRAFFAPPPTFTRRFAFAGRSWETRATPNSAYLDQNQPLGHWLLLGSGALLTLVVAAGFRRGAAQREDLRRLNRALEVEVEARARAEVELKRSLGELQAALASVKTLEGILPICASCKRIRDERGAWSEVETYVSRHTTAAFSHGLCPACARRLYPDVEIPAPPEDPGGGRA